MAKWLLLFLFLPALAFSQNVRFDSQVLGSKGPVGGASIAVCTQPANTSTQPCTPLASLCSSATDAVCTSANPVTSDPLGNFHFYVKSSSTPVTVQIYGPGVAQAYVMTDQLIPTSASGGVTSVGITAVPSGFSVSSSTSNPVISTGNFTIGYATGQASHQVLGTCGTATSFGPCSLVPGDIPTLNQSTTGNAATATAFSVVPTKCTVGNAPIGIDSSGNAQNCTALSGATGFASMTNGFAAIATGATTGTSYSSTQSPRIYAFLVPGTGGGTDLCSKWNAALLLLPSHGGTVDNSVGFSDPQFCLMNPYNGVSSNLSSVSLLGEYRIFSSVPILTNSFRHTIRGAGTGSGTTQNGTTIILCNASGPETCNASGNPTFPNASDVLTFAVQHGPFAAGSYSAAIHGGGAGVKGGSSAFGEQIRDLSIDLNGLTNVFGYYTTEEQELGILDGINVWNGGTNSAAVFCDSSEVDGTGSNGPGCTHFQIHRFHFFKPQSATNTYGIVSEGARIQVTVSGLTCTTQPKAYATVSGGAVTIQQTYYGSGCTGTPACTVTSGDTPTTSATCSATLGSPGAGQVTIARTAAGSGYSNGDGNVSTLYISDGTIVGVTNTTALTAAIWLDGQNNSKIDGVHCESAMTGLQWGNGTGFMQAGALDGLDCNNAPAGTTNIVDIGNGGDGGFRTKGIDGTFTNLLTDEMTNAVSGIQDGSHLVSWTKASLNKAIEAYSPFGYQIPSGVLTPEVTFANLPACSSTIAGLERSISDSNTVVFNATAAGSGTNHVAVRCNGTNWVVF